MQNGTPRRPGPKARQLGEELDEAFNFGAGLAFQCGTTKKFAVIPTKVGTQDNHSGAQRLGSVPQLLGPDFRRDDCLWGN
jgi:hypothetical protein